MYNVFSKSKLSSSHLLRVSVVDLVTEQPPQNLWQITKEKNQNEFVSVPCVPNFVG